MKNQKIIHTQYFSLSIFFLGLIALVAGVAVVGCKKEPAYQDKVLVTGTDVNNTVNFTVDGAGSSTAITATASGIVNQDVNVTFKIDTTLLAAYNQKNGTNFRVPPAGSFTLIGNEGTIKAGTNVSGAVSLKIVNTDNFVDGRNYMIPVSISVPQQSLEVLETSKTAFVKLNKVVVTSVFNTTNGRSFVKTFPKVLSLPNFTFEFRINVSQFGSGFHISRLGVFQDTLADNSGHSFNLFRFGELSDDINQLQWINTAGKISSKTRFATNTWYTVSCVFDGNTCTMYVNGVADGSFPAAGAKFNFNELDLLFDGQPLPGYVSEVRLWSKALTTGEMQNGFCGVDPSSPGLVAYWRFNEGKGKIINDYSGHGYTFSLDADANWAAGIRCPN
ncbi:DUF1735 domain-containing protein [Mucilaginibacter sp. 21P]|uniref:DUF1735 and LamG domain-containing protein n=1 Tax=Mucilaginibacter sp. 21P TaxID=2778902 RepID=UPI001C5638A5|nr:DUF1735 and LamG domain-containing protein [Mucilaginibacter sp. 21P]QXV64705.1 DUF1735 domain-containing protein [Mucilaginibacter sp. 21P]